MSATNATSHYEFPVFVGSDKPAWLVDWNGAMASIDSAIYEAKSTADSAVTAAAAVASDLATLSGTVSTQGSSITTLSETLTTAVGNINTINGNINTINSLIGNGTPTTTDQTIIGAINEINAKFDTTDPDSYASSVEDAIAAVDAKIGLKVQSYPGLAVTTNTAGSAVLTSHGTRFVIGVHFDSLGTGNYRYSLGQAGDTTYINVTDEQGVPITNTVVHITYAYIDFA